MKGLPLVKENDRRTDSKDEDIEEGQEEEGNYVDDLIDELDRDGGGEENEQVEEITSEEEKEGLLDDQEYVESVQEAREESYKRDDVSSAVQHDIHAKRLEIKSKELGVDNVEKQANGTVDDAKSNTNSTMAYSASMSSLSNVASGRNMMIPEAGLLPMKGSYSEAEGKEVELSKPDNGPLSTPLSTKGSYQKELKPNTTTTTLPENNIELIANMSYSQMRIQKNPSLVYSVSNRENPQHKSSGKTDTRKGNEPDDHPTTSE